MRQGVRRRKNDGTGVGTGAESKHEGRRVSGSKEGWGGGGGYGRWIKDMVGMWEVKKCRSLVAASVAARRRLVIQPHVATDVRRVSNGRCSHVRTLHMLHVLRLMVSVSLHHYYFKKRKPNSNRNPARSRWIWKRPQIEREMQCKIRLPCNDCASTSILTSHLPHSHSHIHIHNSFFFSTPALV